MIDVVRAGNEKYGRANADAPHRCFIDDLQRRTTDDRQATGRRERLPQPAILDAARMDGLDGVQEQVIGDIAFPKSSGSQCRI